MKLFVSDFDDTLFRSAYPPDGWDRDRDGYWWELPESLGPPCVPKVPGMEWWNQQVVKRATQLIRDPEWFCCCLTGRRTHQANFSQRIPWLLEQKGLLFDLVRLCPADGSDQGATGPWKLSVIQRLARRFDADEIEIWDDRADHLADWEAALLDYNVNTVHVQEPHRQCRGFRFRGRQYIEVNDD